MMKKQKIKNFIISLIICLSVLLPTVMAFAEDTEETSNQTYAQTVTQQHIDRKEELLSILKSEEMKSQQKTASSNYAKLVDESGIGHLALGEADPGVRKFITGAAYELTVEYGYKKIDQMLNSAGYSGTTKDNIANLWKENFSNLALSYGFPANDGVDDLVAGHTESIGLLKWGDANQASVNGSIYAIIQRIYSIQGSQVNGLGNFINAVKGIGMALCVAFSVMTMTTMATERNMTSEALTKEFAKLIFGIWLIANFQWIAGSMLRLGTLILESITQAASTQADPNEIFNRILVESLYELVSENDIGNLTALQATGGAPKMNFGSNPITKWISNAVGGGIVNFIASMSVYAVAIELGIRYAFTPIAIADMFSEKFRSTGVRYLKELLACSMTGAVMYFVVYVAYVLKQTIGPGLLAGAAIDLTMVGMMARARNISSSIVGS